MCRITVTNPSTSSAPPLAPLLRPGNANNPLHPEPSARFSLSRIPIDFQHILRPSGDKHSTTYLFITPIIYPRLNRLISHFDLFLIPAHHSIHKLELRCHKPLH